MGTFQVGDKVRIRGPVKSGSEIYDYSDGYSWEDEMDAFLGVTTEVTRKAQDGSYEVGADEGTYGWVAKWLEPVTTEESPTPDMEDAFESWWKSFRKEGDIRSEYAHRWRAAWCAWRAATKHTTSRIRSFVADDSLAVSYQTFGQYRQAILTLLSKTNNN